MKLFTALAAITLIAAPAQAQVLRSHSIINPDGSGFKCTFVGNTTNCNEQTPAQVRQAQQNRIDSLNRNNNCIADLGVEALQTRRMDECMGMPASHIEWLAERKEKQCQEQLNSSVIPAQREWYKECNYGL